MKRVPWACAAAALAWALGASAAPMSVQVREAPVRAAPSFVSPVTATLAYADRVEVLETRGAWSKIARGAGSGWVHASALSAKRVVLAAGREQARAAASDDELALAGKGFNADVEAAFKARNKTVEFAWIDRMEAMRVAPSALQAFLKAGALAPREGGAP